MTETVQPASTRRPYMSGDLRAVKTLYEQEKATLRTISGQMQRSLGSVTDMLNRVEVDRRRPDMCGERKSLCRRNAKIIEAILCGDDAASVMRRWDITARVLYQILYSHKCRTRMSTELWRKNFLSVMSGLR